LETITRLLIEEPPNLSLRQDDLKGWPKQASPWPPESLAKPPALPPLASLRSMPVRFGVKPSCAIVVCPRPGPRFPCCEDEDDDEVDYGG
jgi:hypothetical protein